MRTIILSALAAVALPFSVVSGGEAPGHWVPAGTGCEARSLYFDFERNEDYPLSAGSLRFATIPTPSIHPMVAVVIDSGKSRLATSDGKPFFMASISRLHKTCTIRMPLDECPAAETLADEFWAMQVPTDPYGAPRTSITMDGESYFVEYADSHGNTNRLEYSEPLRGPLARLFEAPEGVLAECIEPAQDAFQEYLP